MMVRDFGLRSPPCYEHSGMPSSGLTPPDDASCGGKGE